jgi:predicted kinase
MDSKSIIIVRGIPGSGKSSFSSLLGRAICSADDYFIRNNRYLWKADKLGFAHSWCQRKCERFLKLGISPVIIDNTSISSKDVNIYIKLAKKYNYKYFSIIIENRHDGINSHNVPAETIKKMKEKFSIKL